MTCQSWRSEKIPFILALLLSKKEFDFAHAKTVFRPPTLSGHSFAAMMLYSSSFESPKSHLFALNLKNSIASFLSYVILAQTNPIYVVLYKWCKLSNGNNCTSLLCNSFFIIKSNISLFKNCAVLEAQFLSLEQNLSSNSMLKYFSSETLF